MVRILKYSSTTSRLIFLFSGGVAVLEAPEAAERASDYGKKLSRKATELSKRHFDSDGLKGANKGMEDVREGGGRRVVAYTGI